MKEVFPKTIPDIKQSELKHIADLISKSAPVEMIILFGSFARGDWVSDKYREGHITYEYQSDFDILVVVKNKDIEGDHSLWNSINTAIKNDPLITTPVSLVVDTVRFVNARLKEGNYFYVDIKNEGIILFDSHAYTLVNPQKLSTEEYKKLASADYLFWSRKAESYLKDYQHNIDDNELNNAAFHLHQAAEALFVANLLVNSGYKPKTHKLSKMEMLVAEFIPQVRTAFPKNTPESLRLFALLDNAYVDARYKVDYVITKQELNHLHSCILELKKITQDYCLPKIA